VQSTTQERSQKKHSFGANASFRRSCVMRSTLSAAARLQERVEKDRTPTGLSIFKDSSTVADRVRVISRMTQNAFLMAYEVRKGQVRN